MRQSENTPLVSLKWLMTVIEQAVTLVLWQWHFQKGNEKNGEQCQKKIKRVYLLVQTSNGLYKPWEGRDRVFMFGLKNKQDPP